MTRRHLLTSLALAIATDTIAALAGAAIPLEVVTPGQWLATTITALPTVAALRFAIAAALIALVVVNGWVIGRRVLEPDAPLVGRVATSAVLGLPAAIAQVAVLVAAYFALLH